MMNFPYKWERKIVGFIIFSESQFMLFYGNSFYFLNNLNKWIFEFLMFFSWYWTVIPYIGLTLHLFMKAKELRNATQSYEKLLHYSDASTLWWAGEIKLISKEKQTQKQLKSFYTLYIAFGSKICLFTQLVPKICSCRSVVQSCSTLCDPMDYSTPGFPVFHYLLQFTQTHVHWVSDAI